MDYTHRRRVKIWGEARVVEDDPAMIKALMPQGYKARPEQVILFRIAAWDTNCPQHIPQKFDAADVAQALALRDARIAELEAELGGLAEFFAQVHRRAVEEMRGSLGKIVAVDPARADQRPIDMMLDHPLEGPGLRARLEAERGVEIEAIFGFQMRPDERGIGNRLGFIDDIGQLPLRRGRRPGLLLAIGKAGHLQLDLGLGHKGADLRQAETGAEAIKRNHAGLPIS